MNEKVGRERFELSTFRLSAERSSQAELPAQVMLAIINLLTVFKCFRTLGRVEMSPHRQNRIVHTSPFYSYLRTWEKQNVVSDIKK